jgi:hypothetical protein
MSLKDFANKAKHLVIEEDAPPAPVKTPPASVPHPAFNLGTGGAAAAPAPAFAPSVFAAATPSASPFSVPSTAVLDEKVYASVLKKTNFDDTNVGKIVHKYYDGLEGVIADPSQRFRAAIGQAQKIDNITPAQILSTFDQLQAALDQDAQAFTNVAAAHDKAEIQTRQTSIAAKQQQVAQLNSEIAQLTAELTDETTRSGAAVQQHNLAQSRRQQEIAAQKAQIAALLQ